MSWKKHIHPDLRRTVRKLPSLTFGPWMTRACRALERLAPIPRREGVEVHEQSVDGREHLIFRSVKKKSPGAILWIHGGGRIMGRPRLAGPPCVRLAEMSGMAVIAAPYRLAPRAPFPAALDDLAASWSWLQETASALDIDPTRVVIGGGSAGGGLAAELSQRLHDEGGVQPRGQLLVYPMLDDRTATDASLTARNHLVWNNTSNHYGWSSYLNQPPGSLEAPPYAVAARREDLSGLPPAWLTVGSLDLFYDENLEYIERLRAAGVHAELDVIEGGFHGYFSVGRDEPPIQRTWRSLDAFLSRVV